MKVSVYEMANKYRISPLSIWKLIINNKIKSNATFNNVTIDDNQIINYFYDNPKVLNSMQEQAKRVK